MTRLNNHCW